MSQYAADIEVLRDTIEANLNTQFGVVITKYWNDQHVKDRTTPRFHCAVASIVNAPGESSITQVHSTVTIGIELVQQVPSSGDILAAQMADADLICAALMPTARLGGVGHHPTIERVDFLLSEPEDDGAYSVQVLFTCVIEGDRLVP